MLTTLNVSKDTEEHQLRKASFHTHEMYSQGRNSAVSYRTKHTLTIYLTIKDSGMYLPKEAENLHPHKNLHMMFIGV